MVQVLISYLIGIEIGIVTGNVCSVVYFLIALMSIGIYSIVTLDLKTKHLHMKKKMPLYTSDVIQILIWSYLSFYSFRYCYYKDTHKILGNTYGMLVLQVLHKYMTINIK